MKKLLLVLALIAGLQHFSQAQSYSSAVGVRAGAGYGGTIKHFISDAAALEGIVFSRWRGLNLTGLYEYHRPAFDVEGLRWFLGGGAHLGFWNGTNSPWFADNEDYVVIGADFIIGFDYAFSQIPLNLSVDIKPGYNFVGHTGFNTVDGGGVSARYIF